MSDNIVSSLSILCSNALLCLSHYKFVVVWLSVRWVIHSEVPLGDEIWLIVLHEVMVSMASLNLRITRKVFSKT